MFVVLKSPHTGKVFAGPISLLVRHINTCEHLATYPTEKRAASHARIENRMKTVDSVAEYQRLRALLDTSVELSARTFSQQN